MVFSSNVEYVGVILDSKLDWRLNIELRGKKTCIALCARKRKDRELVAEVLWYGFSV